MKFLKIKLGIFSLLAILGVLVFLTSCEQDTIIPDVVESGVDELSSLEYNKDIEILSENGLSKITITASGNDESLLDEIKQEDFKIIPVFEEPAEDLHQTDDRNLDVPEDAEASEGGMPIAFTVSNVELEEGAIGYKIEVDQTDLSRIEGAGSRFWYFANNKVKVDRYQNCVRAEFWKQQYWRGSWSYQWNDNRCDNYPSYYYWGGNSHQVIVKISGGSYYRYGLSSWN